MNHSVTHFVPVDDTQAGQRNFTSIGIAELLSIELPPRETLIEPWLPKQGLALIYGPRGLGKTHVAIGVGYACTSASNFLRWRADKPHGVLYIDGEMPASVLQERLAEIVRANDKEPVKPFSILTPDFQSGGMPDISNPEDHALIERHLENIDLIILDNISTLCRTGKENEAGSWLIAQEWALNQRAKGRSVLFIHHSGKGGAQRGTSKREDVLDTVISLKHGSDYTPDQGAAFEVHFEKNRGFYGDYAQPFEAQLTTDEHGQQVWITRSLEDSTFDKVVRLMNDGLSQKDITIELSLSKSTVNHHVKRARIEGLLPLVPSN